MRYVGIKHDHICVVSDTSFINEAVQVISVPIELEHLTDAQLITDCNFEDGTLKPKITERTLQGRPRLAFVGNWKMPCGLATYNQNLLPHIVKHLPDFKLFIEKNEYPTGDIYKLGNKRLLEEQVSVCWKRGDPLDQLAKEIKEFSPDVILIGHEFGLFPNARHWLSLMTQLSSFRVIVIMHSVFPYHYDKSICEAAMPEIIVHLEQAKYNLKMEKKINAIVSVIPHGCYTNSRGKLWNFYKSDKTFIQVGFGFPYKKFSDSIRATALLKDKYSDVFFTALISESPYASAQHQVYYDELLFLVNELGLQNNVALIRGFQSDQVMDSFLGTNQVAVFPYGSNKDHEVFGASGAARLAMSRGLPIITSSIPHFSDLPSIKANSPEEIAENLEKLFTDKTFRTQQLEKQEAYLIENSWEKIGLKYVELLTNNKSV
jgi:glycosyltransferase involved in cell wall biosynthesis